MGTPNLSITDFGPIEKARLDIQSRLVFIGPQASGKSTISKLIFFFRFIRDEISFEVVNYVLQGRSQELKKILIRKLRNRFVEFFGPTTHATSVDVLYNYGNELQCRVRLDDARHAFITPVFNDYFYDVISEVIQKAKEHVKSSSSAVTFPSSGLRRNAAHQRLIDYVQEQLKTVFNDSSDHIYIPAGRSMLSTISDQISFIHPHKLDYLMRNFLETIDETKVMFENSLESIIARREALTTQRIDYAALKKARTLIQRILKGQFRYNSADGGRIYYSVSKYAKLNFASSGQQEAVWIVLLLFLIILDSRQTFLVVEEPEAHLFPDAQKDLVEMIALAINKSKSQFLLTTHSPYIVSSLNNLLMASSVYQKHNRKPSSIDEDLWINPAEMGAYFVADSTICPILDEESDFIKVELIDRVTQKLSEDFENILSGASSSAEDDDT